MSSSSLDKIEDRVLNDDPDGLRHLLGEVKSMVIIQRKQLVAVVFFLIPTHVLLAFSGHWALLVSLFRSHTTTTVSAVD